MKAAGLLGGAALACVGLVLCFLAYTTEPNSSELLSTKQSLYYNDAGLSYSERSAMQKSKEMARKVARGEKKDPSIVDTLMHDLKKYKNHLEAQWEFGIEPALIQAGLKQNHASATLGLQQLRVVMTECVKCVSECPAYVKKPFSASSFDDFQSKAMADCPMCYHSVAGPCPADKNNHGVVEKEKKLTQLHVAKTKTKAKAGAHKAPASKWSGMMGTNRAFLGDTFHSKAESSALEQAAQRAESYGVET